MSYFYVNATPTTEIYTLSLHDALPIYPNWIRRPRSTGPNQSKMRLATRWAITRDTPEISSTASKLVRSLYPIRSEEHTSELQSPMYLVCRLLLEKKKTISKIISMIQTN